MSFHRCQMIHSVINNFQFSNKTVGGLTIDNPVPREPKKIPIRKSWTTNSATPVGIITLLSLRASIKIPWNLSASLCLTVLQVSLAFMTPAVITVLTIPRVFAWPRAFVYRTLCHCYIVCYINHRIGGCRCNRCIETLISCCRITVKRDNRKVRWFSPRTWTT